MYALNQPLYAANDNIRECRFLVAVGPSLAEEAAGGTVPLLGVSWEASRFPPGSLMDDGFIAVAGEGVMYHGYLQIANVIVGTGGVTAENLLTAEAGGTAIVATTGKYVGGKALQTGVAGDKIECYVLPPLLI